MGCCFWLRYLWNMISFTFWFCRQWVEIQTVQNARQFDHRRTRSRAGWGTRPPPPPPSIGAKTVDPFGQDETIKKNIITVFRAKLILPSQKYWPGTPMNLITFSAFFDCITPLCDMSSLSSDYGRKHIPIIRGSLAENFGSHDMKIWMCHKSLYTLWASTTGVVCPGWKLLQEARGHGSRLI